MTECHLIAMHLEKNDVQELAYFDTSGPIDDLIMVLGVNRAESKIISPSDHIPHLSTITTMQLDSNIPISLFERIIKLHAQGYHFLFLIT